MDFELSKEQKDIQKAARRFAKGEFDRELALELEEKHEFPTEIWKKAADEGFIGLHYPEEYGGSGYGVIENTLVVEEFCRRDSGIGAALMTVDFASENVLRYGTHEQKERYLPPVAEGTAISAGAITEPEHGSDITSMATTAVRDADERVRQSMILVDKDAEGLTTASVGQKMGLRMIPTGEVSLKDVRVPAENLLGQEGKGFYQILGFFDESRIETAAQAIGTAQGAFDRALEYVKGRVQFGKKIAQFQVTQHKLADMATKIELARLITYKAAWTADQGKPDTKLTAMAKYYAGHAAKEVTDEAVQLLGGYGYMTEFEVERFYRDVRITEIYEGSREIQKNIIASAVIGRLK